MTENLTTTEVKEQAEALTVSPEELSTNMYWVYGKNEQFNLQTTIRGNPTQTEIIEHFASAIEGMAHVVRLGGHAKQVGKQPDNPAPIVSDAERAQASGKGNGAPPAPPAPSHAQTNSPRDEAHCIAIEVGKTYTGDKTQLKFTCKGMEHPLTYAKSEADMVKLLAPLGYTIAHIVRGEKYPADAVIVWEQGEKYKNVISVRPAA